MTTALEYKNNPTANRFRNYFGFVMVLLYIVLGGLFLFTDIASETFSQYRTGIGITFIIYGIIRSWMTWKKIKREE
jgi:hypothetical protein